MGAALRPSDPNADSPRYYALPSFDISGHEDDRYSVDSQQHGSDALVVAELAERGHTPTLADSGFLDDDEHEAANLTLFQGDGATKGQSYKFADLRKPYCVFRRGLLAKESVGVCIGPIVGRVTSTKAIVLLEVLGPPGISYDCSVNFARVCDGTIQSRDSNVWSTKPKGGSSALSSLIFEADGSVTVNHTMENGRPHSFVVNGLRPSTRYVVLLSGVSQKDIDRRVARLSTFSERLTSSPLRLVGFGNCSLPSHAFGGASPLAHLLDFLRDGAELTLTLHLAGTVDVASSANEAAAHLVDHASFREGARRDLEGRARQVLRRAYHRAWGSRDSIHDLLAGVGAQLCVFVPPVQSSMLRQLANKTFASDAAEWESRVLLRVAVDVYREYQRVLWNHEVTSSLNVSATTASFPEFWVSGGSLSQHTEATFSEEWHFHKYGPLSVVVLDSKSNFVNGILRGGGVKTMSLSSAQWKALDQMMRDVATRVLVVVSDEPILIAAAEAEDGGDGQGASLPSPTRYTRVVKDTSTSIVASRNQERPQDVFTWQSRPKDLLRLLGQLFAWKNEQFPLREVLLVSAGPGFSTSGSVHDRQLGLSLPSVLVGPTESDLHCIEGWQLSGSLSAGRFTYAHRRPWGNCCAVAVDVDCGAPGSKQKPSVDIQFVEMPVPADEKVNGRASMRI